MKYILGLKQLPFEQDEKQIIYVENEYDENANRYIRENYDSIIKHFHSLGYEFCYIPYLALQLSKSELMKYYAPFAVSDFTQNIELKSDFLLNWMTNPNKRSKIPPSLLYYQPIAMLERYDAALCQFRGIALTSDSGYDQVNDFSTVLDEIIVATNYHNSQFTGIRFHKASKNEVDGFLNNLSDDEREDFKRWLAMEARFRPKGLTTGIFEYLTEGEDKISPMRITKDFHIILVDNNVEIELRALPKALYLLFLNHPTGISFQDLDYYKEELLKIYQMVNGDSFVTTAMRNTIDRLVGNKDYISQNIRYIRQAFHAAFKEQIAKNYTIEGKQGGERSVKLSRELIFWDFDMLPPMDKPQVKKHIRLV